MAYSDDDRVLDIKGLITYPDTATQAITSTHISSFHVDEDAGGDVPVGAAPAASFELKLDNSSGQWEPGGSILGVHILDGAKVEIEIGLWNGATYDYSNIGTYYVDDVQGQEHETLIRLKGSDAMVSLMSEYYADAPGDYPQTLGDLLTDIATTAGVTLESAVFTNSAVSIPSQPVWRNDLTCREAAGYIAACAGGIALFNRDGKLEIITLETVSSWSIGTSVYKTFTRGDTFFGALNAINVYTYGAPDGTAPTRYATAPATPDTSLNSINIKGNPILAYGSTALASLGAGMLAALTGLYFRGATFKWHGDPTMVLGDLCTVTDLATTAVPVLVTKQKISFGPGFGMDSGCEVTTSTKADASGKLQKIFTPTGNLNAEALAGNIYVRAGEIMTLESDGIMNVMGGAEVNIESGGNLNIESGGDLHVLSGGDMEIEGGADINVASTGKINIASGGEINVASGGDLNIASGGSLNLSAASQITIGTKPMEVGGTNLLTDTDYETSAGNWSLNTVSTTQQLSDNTAMFGAKSLLIARPANDADAGVYISCSFISGQVYTFSVWAYKDAGTYTIGCTAGTGTVAISDAGWKRYSLTFTATSASGYIYIASENSASNTAVYIERPKLETGNVATDWCEAEGELHNSSITLDSDGIEILSGGDLIATAPGTLKITGGSTDATAIAIRNDTDYFLSAGDLTQADAPFFVKKDGSIKAISGFVGGFTLASNHMYYGAYNDSQFVDLSQWGLACGPDLNATAENQSWHPVRMTTALDDDYGYFMAHTGNIGMLKFTPTYFGINSWPSDSFYGSGNTGSGRSQVFVIDKYGNMWTAGDVDIAGDLDAATYTDFTPAFSGDALKALSGIKGDGHGNIDHSSLPTEARKEIARKILDSSGEQKLDESGKPLVEKKPGRNISVMVSILTKAVQELMAVNDTQNARIEALEKEIELLKAARI